MQEKPYEVFFISAGPGDPGLMTLSGAEALKACPFVLAPAQFAESFAKFLNGKEVRSPFQMDRATLTSWVEERLQAGSVAFLVPGDFSVFCPFQSFAAYFGARSVVIPGVSTHVAAMSILKKSMDVPGVAHAAVITSTRAHTRGGEPAIPALADPGRTLVLYMMDKPLAELVTSLSPPYGEDTPIAIFERVACPGQKVTVSTLGKVVDDFGGRDPFGLDSDSPEPALALVIVGDAVATDEAPGWWDHRYEKVWKPRNMR